MSFVYGESECREPVLVSIENFKEYIENIVENKINGNGVL